ncbi:hypothetical protein ABT324_02415 [Saccharopolyspora sp. NPDC000359]|uniref:hypothetical protein n=1 Tax=Saccharopolyspora sp. NPDC000359 TaxID=3154251 RepID=UPI0033333C73
MNAPDQANYWQCECDTCNGRGLGHFALIENHGKRTDAAFRHSFQRLLDVKEGLFRPGLTSADRRNSWI